VRLSLFVKKTQSTWGKKKKETEEKAEKKSEEKAESQMETEENLFEKSRYTFNVLFYTCSIRLKYVSKFF